MTEADRFLQAGNAANDSHAKNHDGTILNRCKNTMEAERFLKSQQETEASSTITTDEMHTGTQRMVGMGEALKRMFTTWNWNGRASRSEYWFAWLPCFLINIAFNCCVYVFYRSLTTQRVFFLI